MRRAWGIIAVVMVGCGGELLDEDIDFDEQSLVAQNGVSLNGVSLNGVSLNGVSLNGVSLNGVSLNGVSLNGVSLNGVSLNGTALTGTRSGVAITGAGFVGSQFTASLSNGSTMKLRVDDAAPLTAPNADVWAYGISFQSTATTWLPLCASGAKAIPIVGTFNMGQGVTGGGSFTYDTSKITFGCRGTAIAKCIEIGYKPWKTVSGTSLRNHHVACTRMIRADYCGDGKAYTVDGTAINVYDGLGVQVDGAVWPNDAEWSTSGARCVGRNAPPRLLNSGTVPACYASRYDRDCGKGSHFPGGGTLLVDETL